MTTNEILQLINAAIPSKQGGGNTMQVVNGILAALGPLLAAVVLWVNARTTRTLTAIHTEVNHAKTVMEEELGKLRESVTELTGKNKVLEERERGNEKATAVAAATPTPERPPLNPVVFTPEQLAQIQELMKSQKG